MIRTKTLAAYALSALVLSAGLAACGGGGGSGGGGNLPPGSGTTPTPVPTLTPTPGPGTMSTLPIPAPSGDYADPMAITTGPDGNLWMSTLFYAGLSHNGNGVLKVTPSGQFTPISLPGNVTFPGGIVSGPDGNLWLAVGGLGSGYPSGIARISTAGQSTFFAFTGNDLSVNPTDIVAGPDGNLWFVDGLWDSNHQYTVGKITPSGQTTFYPLPFPNIDPTLELQPSSITTGPDGNLWITEWTRPATSGIFVDRITTAGQVTQFPIPQVTQAALGATLGSITAGSDGNLWFTEAGNYNGYATGAIGRITTSGQATLFPIGTNIIPSDIISTPSGELWFSTCDAPSSWNDLGSPTGGGIGSISTSGQFGITSQVPGNGTFPAGLALGSDGNIWFPIYVGEIGKLIP